MKAILIDEVESQIERIYDNYSLKPEDRLLVEAYMQECIANEREKYKAELNSLVHEKNRLERRQEKLLEAHFNDAIPMDLLKREQKAISKQLAAIRYEIDAHNATFEEIVEKLTLVMDMLEDCGATYRKANENIKRLMNQSIFKKIWINPDGSVEPKMTKICEGVFEAKRDIKKSAPTAVDADSIRKLFKSGSNFFEQGLNNDFLVGLTGPHSNYKILYKKVKAIKASIPVKSESNQALVDSSYDPNFIVKSITQQQKHLKPEEIEQIVQGYRNGESTYELAEAFNCHRSTIANNLRKQGIKVTVEKIDLEEAIMLYESGWTTKQLAERYHISDNAVSRRLKAAGVKMRTRWDYPRE